METNITKGKEPNYEGDITCYNGQWAKIEFYAKNDKEAKEYCQKLANDQSLLSNYEWLKNNFPGHIFYVYFKSKDKAKSNGGIHIYSENKYSGEPDATPPFKELYKSHINTYGKSISPESVSDMLEALKEASKMFHEIVNNSGYSNFGNMPMVMSAYIKCQAAIKKAEQ